MHRLRVVYRNAIILTVKNCRRPITAGGWRRLKSRAAERAGVPLSSLEFCVLTAGGRTRDGDALTLVNMGATHVLVSGGFRPAEIRRRQHSSTARPSRTAKTI